MTIPDQIGLNQIHLTTGQDAGTVIVPELPPPTMAPSAPYCPPEIYAPEGLKSNKVLRPDYAPYGFKKDGQPRSGKFRRFAGKFIEFYDPELERPDVQDYQRSTLLVGQTNEVAPPPPEDRLKVDILSRKITDIKPTLNYAWGDYKPEDLPEDFFTDANPEPYVDRVAPRTVLQWEPTNLWYYPLYFEDVGLERYGHTRKPWLQPLVSTGRFFGQVVGLPYQMALHPPKSREFALGHYQPGEWAPKKRYRIPFNEEAAASQFLWVTALVLLVP